MSDHDDSGIGCLALLVLLLVVVLAGRAYFVDERFDRIEDRLDAMSQTEQPK